MMLLSNSIHKVLLITYTLFQHYYHTLVLLQTRVLSEFSVQIGVFNIAF